MKRDQVNLLRRFLKNYLVAMYDFTFITKKQCKLFFWRVKGIKRVNLKKQLTLM